jgi:hypothetical protein
VREREVPLGVGVPQLGVVDEPAWPGWRGRAGEVRVAAPPAVRVAQWAERLEAAGGAGAQRAGLAALLELLLEGAGLLAVPDPDQLDRAAGVQRGGE